MNPNAIYQSAIAIEKVDKTSEKVEAEKLERDKLMAWATWRAMPQSQEFIRILTEKKQNLLHGAMRSHGSLEIDHALIEANTIDKIINSLIQNGRYETPQ